MSPLATVTDARSETAIYYLRVAVYVLASVLALSLLTVGTVAIIAELKGTWHWSIHLESTISYMGVFIDWLLTALVPLTALLLAGRWLRDRTS